MGKHVDPHVDWCTVIKENEAWDNLLRKQLGTFQRWIGKELTQKDFALVN